jgi:protein-arginine kinase activator protein McsA
MTKQTTFGTFTPAGDFQAISNVQVTRIEYASKSTPELKELLQEKIEQEQYEQCALIRNEIARR